MFPTSEFFCFFVAMEIGPYKARTDILGAVRLALACLIAVGCGRSGFDVVDDGGRGDVAPDTSNPLAITAREIAPPEFTTSSTAFVDVAGGALEIPPSPGRTWLVMVNGYLSSASMLGDGPEARYLVDGVERGLGGTDSRGDKPGPWQHMFVLTGTTAPITVQLQARDSYGMETTLERVRVVAAPIPDAADPLYASSDAIQSVTAPAMMDFASLTLTPTSAGEYVVFLLFNQNEKPGGSNITSQWLTTAGAVWGPSFQLSRGAWQSALLARRATLGPGPTTFRFQSSSANSSQVAYIRAFALRTSALPSFALREETTRPRTSGVVPVTAASLVVSVATAAHYVVFGTMRVDDSCDVGVGVRGLQFVVDNVTASAEHLTGNCAEELTYGHLELLEAAPSSVSSAFYSANGSEMVHQESTLMVLGVE